LFVFLFCQEAGYIETAIGFSKSTNRLLIFELTLEAALFALKLKDPALPALFQLLLNNSACSFNIPPVLVTILENYLKTNRPPTDE
jgi:hypothetical protein